MAEGELRECCLYSASIQGQSLPDAIEAFFAIDENANQSAFAILYSPRRCFLARMSKDKAIVGASKDDEPSELAKTDIDAVFEARVFNQIAEMRWLNDPNGDHSTAIISELELKLGTENSKAVADVLGGLDQNYLLWGQSTTEAKDGWSQFATARVGAFFIPVPNVPNQVYGRFKAVEYLKTYEDSNVAVVDERLTGIEVDKEEANNG